MPVIEAVLGDITKEEVDAIVNAAHEALMGGGGVDGSIHRAAGPALIRECMAFPKNKEGVRCPVGSAFVTSGCKLPAKFVIHTVAPKFIGSVQTGLMGMIYNNAKDGTDADLAQCYTSCLKQAERFEISSIAFPSLGTGGHAYPIELACPIAVRTVREFFARKETHETPLSCFSSPIRLIRFVCFSKGDLKHYQEELSRRAA